MKKIMIFAVACAALVACSKEAETVVDANHFEKGQEVTLTVKAGESSTRVSSALNSSDEIEFNWQNNDSIKVIVGETSAKFRVSKIKVDGSAEFTGSMPASGSTFDVQYPFDTPDLENQTYSSTGTDVLPHDKMLFTAKGCDISEEEMTFTLTAQNAALRLNLWGTSQAISKIVVTNTSTSATYTLAMNPAVTLPTTEATAQAFFIVVPAGKPEWKFSAEVFDNSSTPASICTFTPTNAQSFAPNTILNMAAKEVKKSSTEPTFTVDANGNTVYFSPGNLYYDGTDFKFETNQYDYHSSLTAPIGLFNWAPKSADLSQDIVAAVMYESMDNTKKAVNNTSRIFFTNATEDTPRDGFTVKVNNKEETGKWRTLSKDEWTYLLNSRTYSYKYAQVKVNKVRGVLIFPDSFTWPSSTVPEPENTNAPCVGWNNIDYTLAQFNELEKVGCIFLPAAGNRNPNDDKDSGIGLQGKDENEEGLFLKGAYWASTADSDNRANRLSLGDNECKPEDSSDRFRGRSVRLVRNAD